MRWCNREERVVKLLIDINADLVMLQECRDLDGHPIQTFLDKLQNCGYSHSVHYDRSGLNQKLLKVVTLWKTNVFNLQESHTLWLGPNPASPIPALEWNQKVARPIGINKLLHLPSRRAVWSFNTHFGYHDLEKMESCKLLPWCVSQLTNNEPVVVAGDFNFFGPTADIHRQALCNSNWKTKFHDTGLNSVTALHHRRENGTFVGSSIDVHRPPLYTIGERLDHIFSLRLGYRGPSIVWNKTMLPQEPAYLQNYDMFPSDHLPLVAEFTFQL